MTLGNLLTWSLSMNKAELQKEWDLLLLHSWSKNPPLHRLVRSFSLLYNPDHNSKDFLDWGRGLNLKRYPNTFNVFGKAPLLVQQYIGNHCMELNSYLYGNATIEEILTILDGLRWVIYKPKRKRRKSYYGNLNIGRNTSTRDPFKSYANKNI